MYIYLYLLCNLLFLLAKSDIYFDIKLSDNIRYGVCGLSIILTTTTMRTENAMSYHRSMSTLHQENDSTHPSYVEGVCQVYQHPVYLGICQYCHP